MNGFKQVPAGSTQFSPSRENPDLQTHLLVAMSHSEFGSDEQAVDGLDEQLHAALILVQSATNIEILRFHRKCRIFLGAEQHLSPRARLWQVL